MMIGLTVSLVAGTSLLAGILFRRWMRATARFLFAPDADEEWIEEKQHCQGPSSGGKLG